MTDSKRTGRRRARSVPTVIVVLAVAGLLLLALPLLGLMVRAPWADLTAILGTPAVGEAIRISLLTSSAATAVGVVFGIPIAWVMARLDFPGKAVLRSVVLLPLVLPPVVGGAALLFAVGRRGWLGPAMESAGLVLPFSIWGAVVAASFVSLPFMVITVEGALRNADQRYEGAAASLGAGSWVTMRRVTLPLIAPSLMAGTALTWARAFGEFGATITFAGNLPGTTQTLPLAVFVALERDRPTAIAISLLMVLVSLLVLVALRDRWWRAR